MWHGLPGSWEMTHVPVARAPRPGAGLRAPYPPTGSLPGPSELRP